MPGSQHQVTRSKEVGMPEVQTYYQRQEETPA